MMESLGLEQNVNFGTQNHGNSSSSLKSSLDIRITTVTPGEFLSDHRWVEYQLNLRRPHTISYKNMDVQGTDMGKILDAMKLDEIHSNSLDDLVFQFQLHVPEKELRIKVQGSRPWYSAGFMDKHMWVRNMEEPG